MSLIGVISAVFTAIFLCIILSYYVLLLKPKSVPKTKEKFDTITIIIPAHDEEQFIAACIHSVMRARFPGKKEIIVVDDGSTDRTAEIVRQHKGVKLFRRPHTGKSASINYALARSKSKLVAVVDGDSAIHIDALENMLPLFYTADVAAVSAVIKVKNRTSLLTYWLHIEQLYSSLTRSLCAKVNVNIVAAGPLSVFRRDKLEEIGGFGTKGYTEDMDIAIRLIRAGYKVEYAEKAITETNMPVTFKGFLRQRTRSARGIVNLLKRHLKADHTLVRIYTLPLTLFSYLQSVVMGSITIYNLTFGYYTYFIAKGAYLNWQVVRFFVEWLTIIGMVRWIANIVSGAIPLTPVVAIAIAASLLTYPLYVLAILRYDKKVTVWHVVAMALLSPFWLLLMGVYVWNIGEWFNKHQENRWRKAE
jgi:peptidoglycan-N-acetylglucosamine deacetylase